MLTVQCQGLPQVDRHMAIYEMQARAKAGAIL